MKSNCFGLVTAVIAVSVTWLPQAQAQARGGGGGASAPGGSHFYAEETFFPVYVSKNDANNSAGGAASKNVPTESGLGLDLRTTLGWQINNWVFGLTFNYYSVGTSRSVTPDYEGKKTSNSRQEFGPTVGYFLNSWRFALTYFLIANKTVTETYTDPVTLAPSTDETWKNTGGTGFQLAVGYDFDLGSGFGISPTLAYRSVKYSKQSLTVRTGSDTPYATTSLQTKAIDDELKPMITVIYRF